MSQPVPREAPQPELSLVFPVFDEAGNIDELIVSACRIGDALTRTFEIVVVDDGSRDGSGPLLDTWAHNDPRVCVVRHPANSGYGAALRSGLAAARGTHVFFSDADLQFDLGELEILLAHANDFDIVAGYRSPRSDPWPRTLIAGVWGLIVRTLFGLRVRDIDCAFKVFNRRVIDAIPLASVGAFINTELLVRARAAGFRIHQVPVTHRRRRHGRQTGAHPRVILRAAVELGALYGELRGADRRAASEMETGPGW